MHALFWLLLVLVPVGVGAIDNIYGVDDRKKVEFKRKARGKYLPYSAIVKLAAWDGECTGALISKNHILTADHCVEGLKPNELTFYTRFDKGRYAHRAQGLEFYRTPARDIAIVKIDKPLGKYVRTLPIAILTAVNVSVTLAGYSSDLYGGQSLTAHQSCRVRSLSSDRKWLNHDCDAAEGASGAPLLVRTTGGSWLIVGVHVADYVPAGVQGNYRTPTYTHEYRSVASSLEFWFDEIVKILE